MVTNAPRNLVLTGFMGTGKSTVGRLVAALLGLRFVDSDAEIVAREGRSISDIFAQDGEAAFRQIERAVILALTSQGGWVIATGGGALINPETRAVVEESNLVVCLTASPETIETRLRGTEGARPLAAHWRTLFEQRRMVYESFAHRIDTSRQSPQHTAQELAQLWHSISSQ